MFQPNDEESINHLETLYKTTGSKMCDGEHFFLLVPDSGSSFLYVTSGRATRIMTVLIHYTVSSRAQETNHTVRRVRGHTKIMAEEAI